LIVEIPPELLSFEAFNNLEALKPIALKLKTIKSATVQLVA
jgi:hypothetical protein